MGIYRGKFTEAESFSCAGLVFLALAAVFISLALGVWLGTQWGLAALGIGCALLALRAMRLARKAKEDGEDAGE